MYVSIKLGISQLWTHEENSIDVMILDNQIPVSNVIPEEGVYHCCEEVIYLMQSQSVIQAFEKPNWILANTNAIVKRYNYILARFYSARVSSSNNWTYL